MAAIDYYLTTSSPWCYLGHEALLGIARRHGATIRYWPTPLNAVFAETGGLPLAKRHPVRQRYRLFELQRWREERGLPLNLRPAYFAADASLADCAAIVLQNAGSDPAGYLGCIHRAKWVEDKDIADPAEIAAALTAAGFAAEPIVIAAQGAEPGDIYAANARAAIEAGIFGCPTYVLNGEPYWGQDRLAMLDRALAAGREAYRVG